MDAVIKIGNGKRGGDGDDQNCSKRGKFAGIAIQ
jgi:hypothetical protein